MPLISRLSGGDSGDAAAAAEENTGSDDEDDRLRDRARRGVRRVRRRVSRSEPDETAEADSRPRDPDEPPAESRTRRRSEQLQDERDRPSAKKPARDAREDDRRRRTGTPDEDLREGDSSDGRLRDRARRGVRRVRERIPSRGGDGDGRSRRERVREGARRAGSGAAGIAGRLTRTGDSDRPTPADGGASADRGPDPIRNPPDQGGRPRPADRDRRRRREESDPVALPEPSTLDTSISPEAEAAVFDDDVPGTGAPARGQVTDQPTQVAPDDETIVDAGAEAVRKRPRETAAAVAAGTFATPAPVDDPVGAAIAGGLVVTAVGAEIARRDPEVPTPEDPVLDAPELPVTGEALPGTQSELSPTDGLRRSDPELPATGEGGATATRIDPSESPVVDRPEVPLAPTGTGTETAPGLSFGRRERTIQITEEVEEEEEQNDEELSVTEDPRFSAFDREGVGRNIGRARTNPEDRANPLADSAEERLPPREAFPSEQRYQEALQRRREEIRQEREEQATKATSPEVAEQAEELAAEQTTETAEQVGDLPTQQLTERTETVTVESEQLSSTVEGTQRAPTETDALTEAAFEADRRPETLTAEAFLDDQLAVDAATVPAGSGETAAIGRTQDAAADAVDVPGDLPEATDALGDDLLAPPEPVAPAPPVVPDPIPDPDPPVDVTTQPPDQLSPPTGPGSPPPETVAPPPTTVTPPLTPDPPDRDRDRDLDPDPVDDVVPQPAVAVDAAPFRNPIAAASDVLAAETEDFGRGLDLGAPDGSGGPSGAGTGLPDVAVDGTDFGIGEVDSPILGFGDENPTDGPF